MTQAPAPGQPSGRPRTAGDEPRLPWDEEAERAVLGAIILDPVAVDAAAELLEPDDFHRPGHREVFKALVSLSLSNQAIDPVTIRHELERAGSLETAGGPAYIGSLIEDLPRAVNVSTYAQIVHDRALLRRLMHVTDELGTEASAGRERAMDLIERAESRLFELSDAGRRGGFQSIGLVAQKTFDDLSKRSKQPRLVTGIETGFSKLDRMTSGLQDGDLVIIAARPSMGKTALALNIAQFAARQDAAVGIFSLEMAAEQLLLRMLASESMVSSHKLRTGNLEPDEWERITQAFDTLSRCQISIDDTPAVTPMEVRSKARRLKREGALDLLVVDYLQLMAGDRRTDSRQQEISDISRSLKGLAKELSVPIIALSQLSRAPDQRVGDHRPQLSDLRESGAIEQDADIVTFIYRPEVYEKEPEKIIEKQLEGKAELIVAKQRNGPTGTVPLYFVKEHTQFRNREEDFG